MNKTGFFKASMPTDNSGGGEVKVVRTHVETSSSVSAKRVPPLASALAARLRAHLSSLTVLEACTLFSLIHRWASGEDTLLKCAAADAGVSEALIVKMAKKLGFEGFRQLREALDEHNRLAEKTDLYAELCVPEEACKGLTRLYSVARSVRRLRGFQKIGVAHCRGVQPIDTRSEAAG
jgi:hypothetical protein